MNSSNNKTHKSKHTGWTKNSWRNFSAAQQPVWPDPDKYENVLTQLSSLPALVYAGETRALHNQLAEASAGRAFVLQCGDCSEDFSSCNGPKIHSLIKVILQMSLILTYAGEKKVVNIGRIAGQYAKPRSADSETVNGLELPSYRGDMINSPEPDLKARTPDPDRILESYFRSAATLNLVRAFTMGGYAAVELAEQWHRDFAGMFPVNHRYERLVKGIKKAVSYSKAIGINSDLPQFNQMALYTSHEALLLGYEESLTRIDTTTGLWYDTSAHMLWIGDRTRRHDSAHAEFLSGVNNPVGIKIGPTHSPDEILLLIEKLNPRNIPGRISLITRLGSQNIDRMMSALITAINRAGYLVTWICDPMHGNTYKTAGSIKTRKFDDICSEINSFFRICRSHHVEPAGIHLELTGENVTECTGGISNICDNDLAENYRSNCDPRLNAGQAIELAFIMSDILNADAADNIIKSED